MAIGADAELSRRVKELVDVDLLKLYRETGIDLSDLPPVITPKRLAAALDTTTDSLAQDRHRSRGVPFVRVGGPDSRRIRYLRGDVARHLLANRVEFLGAE
jgi:hypothetical protein